MKTEKSLRIKRVNRKRQVTISVNGNPVAAYVGEILLAALFAAGYRSFGHNPVNGSPRGGFCGMGICRECLVTVNGVPGTRACMTFVKDGMEVEIDD